jgi:hypothetical protein
MHAVAASCCCCSAAASFTNSLLWQHIDFLHMPRKSPNFGGPEIEEASNQPRMTFEITKKHRKDFLNVRWDDSYAARDVAFCWSGVNVRCHNKPFDLFNIGD